MQIRDEEEHGAVGLKRLDSMRRLLLVMIANERRGGEWNHRKR